MTDVPGQVTALRDRLLSLHERISNLPQAKIDPIARYRRLLMTGPLAELNIEAHHLGTARGHVQLDNAPKRVNITLFIDDILEVETHRLYYCVKSFDPKLTHETSLATIIQADGIVRIEPVVFRYREGGRDYCIDLSLNKPLAAGRIFLTFTFSVEITGLNLDVDVDLDVVIICDPCDGCPCRPCRPNIDVDANVDIDIDANVNVNPFA